MDTPLGEESERYELRLGGDGFSRTLELNGPFYHYTAEERAADGGGAALASVSQIGTFAASQAAILALD